MADIAFEKDLSVAETGIGGLKVVDLAVHGDSRGWFKENWQRAKMCALGIPDLRVVQNNVSYNDSRGVTRGIHAEPWDKFISVARGSVFGAYTAVDRAETPEGRAIAWKANATGPAPARPHLRRARHHARPRVLRLRLRRHCGGPHRGRTLQPAVCLRPDQGRRRHCRGRVPAPLHHAQLLGHRRGAQLRQGDEGPLRPRSRPRG